MSTKKQFEVRKLGFGLGAEIIGLDLSKPQSADVARQLRQAWFDSLVLVVRNQNIGASDLIRFGEYLGEVEDCPHIPYRHPDNAKILLLSNEPIEGKPSQLRNAGRHWHTDLSYTTRPAAGSILHSQKIPEVGGDTMFTNMYLAYETLSEGFKKLIQPLQAVHDLMGNRDFQNRDPAQVKFLREKNPLVAQPLVRFHPETGRPSLYLAEQQVTQIVGMTRQESASILRYLVEHSIQPAFTYRHRWQLHDILVWDNRCTMHFAVPDFDQSQSRVMHRINTNGEYSGEVVTEDELEAKTHARESSIMSAVSA